MELEDILPMLSLRFLESSDRRSINLAARTCKTNKEPTVGAGRLSNA